MVPLILGLMVFLGIHSVRIVAPEWRNRQLKTLGEGPWKGIYSLVSLAGLVLLIWGYGRAWEVAPILYEPPVWMKHTAALLMFFSFVSLMVFIFPAGHLKPILKHPFLAAVQIWAFAHLLANGDLASVILFGAFLAWAVIDRIAVEQRGEAAALPGPVKWDILAVMSGAVLYILFIWRLHLWLIGVPPLA
ncbi:MAG TPA: NnrU family protein [Pseudaminobacter sp.]|nr:NnrU family protein [Pseudaminobacter sp.]